MHEIVMALEQQLEQTGVIALDKVQSRHLIQWLKTLILGLQQQDALIARLKEICQVEPSQNQPSRVHSTVVHQGTGEGEVILKDGEGPGNPRD